eukprot:1917235-Amphidinium_carterae.1
MPYSCIQVTESMPDQGLPAHRDAGNVGYSDIIALGQFTGGELWISSANGQTRLPDALKPLHQTLPSDCSRGTWHCIDHRWLCFDGRAWHSVKPFKGNRTSVIFFNVSGVHSLPHSDHQAMCKLGFKVPAQPSVEQAWLQPMEEDPAADDEDGAAPPALITHLSRAPADTQFTVAVIAERLRLLQRTLQEQGGELSYATSSHVRARRCIPEDLKILEMDFVQSVPTILWLQYQGDSSPGRRAQARLIKEHLQKLALSVVSRGGTTIVECRASDVPVREEVFQDAHWQTILPYQGQTRGCQLAAPQRAQRCCGYLYMSNREIPADRCRPDCRAPPSPADQPLLDAQQIYCQWVRHLVRHSMQQSNQPSGTAPPSSQPPSSPSEPSYPTESALRAKQRKQQDAIQRVGVRRKPQELVYDDCGSDVELLNKLLNILQEESFCVSAPPTTLASCHAEFVWQHLQMQAPFLVSQDIEALYHFTACATTLDYLAEQAFPMHLEDLLREMEQSWQHYYQHYQFDQWTPHINQRAAPLITPGSILRQVQQERTKQWGLLELFGGHGTCTSIAVRRNMAAGGNVDILRGIDVGNPRTRYEVAQAVELSQGTPQHQRSLQNGILCSRFAADLARIQLEAGRHVVIENPRGSDLFARPEWTALQRQYQLIAVTFPQCALGLQSPSGQPIFKPTTLWSSDERLVQEFRQLQCTCSTSHRTIEGSEQGIRISTWAGRWPLEMCRRLVRGIARILRQDYFLPVHAAAKRRPALAYPTDMDPEPHSEPPQEQPPPPSAFWPPAAAATQVHQEEEEGSRPQGPDLLPPVAAAPATAPPATGMPVDRAEPAIAIRFNCAACKRHLVMTHPTHTRETTGPRRCKYPNIAEVPRRCEGCRRAMPSDHRSHSLEPGDCRFSDLLDQLWKRPRLRVRAAPDQGGRPADRAIPPVPIPLMGPTPGSVADEELDLDAQLERDTLERQRELQPVRASAAAALPPLPPPAQPPARQHGEQQDEERDLQMALERSKQLTRGRGEEDEERALQTPGTSTRVQDDRSNYAPDGGLSSIVPPASAPSTPRPEAVGTIPGTPGRGPDTYQRVRRTFREEAAQAGSAQLDWRHYDISKAFAGLHCASEKTKLLTLRRLHVRFFHVGIKALSDLLRLAGVAEDTITLVPLVVHSCTICRQWETPGRRNRIAFRSVDRHNQELQMDLMFYNSSVEPAAEQKVILHMIDVATRYSRACTLTSKGDREICSSISSHWIMIHGAPQSLVVDSETAMSSQYTAEWAEFQNIQLHVKPPHAEAWIIERHNGLLRAALHKAESQVIDEGRKISFEDVLAMTIYMKNAMTTYGDHSPYEAVFGRRAHILPPLTSAEPGSEGQEQQRLREIAIAAITSAHAAERLKRASKHHSTPMLTADSYPKGAQVDIWMNPTSKDASGWRGPAIVHLADPEHDIITVKWQTKTLDRRSAEIRPHVTYLLTETLPGAEQSWQRMVSIISQQQSPSCLAVGHHLHGARWQKTAQSMKTPGRQLLQQAEIIATHIGLSSPFMLRWSRL